VVVRFLSPKLGFPHVFLPWLTVVAMVADRAATSGWQ